MMTVWASLLAFLAQVQPSEEGASRASAIILLIVFLGLAATFGLLRLVALQEQRKAAQQHKEEGEGLPEQSGDVGRDKGA
ncbi:MAG: hypothetical protein AB7W28_04245 [Armatimonadota bacterium]